MSLQFLKTRLQSLLSNLTHLSPALKGSNPKKRPEDLLDTLASLCQLEPSATT